MWKIPNIYNLVPCEWCRYKPDDPKKKKKIKVMFAQYVNCRRYHKNILEALKHDAKNLGNIISDQRILHISHFNGRKGDPIYP